MVGGRCLLEEVAVAEVAAELAQAPSGENASRTAAG
jgi:hypothetical protein